MPVLQYPLSIQSWCFRGSKTNAEVCERLKACGAEAIELCGVHVDFADAAAVEAAVQTYAQAGVRIVASGVNDLAGDVEKERPLFEFLAKAGARYMSVTFSPGMTADAFRRVEELATAYDVRLGIHNHGGRHWLGSSQILRHLFSITGERIGLWLDTAWALDAGEDPVAMVQEFGSRLYGLHLKDFIFDAARRPTDVVLGTGNLDLPALGQALDNVGFAGAVVIEYEGDVENPVSALSDCVQRVRTVFTSSDAVTG